MGAAQIVPPEIAAISREAELDALAKQNGKAASFYLNRAGVKTASDMSDADWDACVAAIKKSIAAKKERDEMLREGQP